MGIKSLLCSSLHVAPALPFQGAFAPHIFLGHPPPWVWSSNTKPHPYGAQIPVMERRGMISHDVKTRKPSNDFFILKHQPPRPAFCQARAAVIPNLPLLRPQASGPYRLPLNQAPFSPTAQIFNLRVIQLQATKYGYIFPYTYVSPDFRDGAAGRSAPHHYPSNPGM
jgi:hypothetical protein